MWLLIDDLRNVNCDVIARTPEAGKTLLMLHEWGCLCLDHDLGAETNGYQIATWALENGYMPERVQLVTSNPVGRENIARVLMQYNYTTKDGWNYLEGGS